MDSFVTCTKDRNGNIYPPEQAGMHVSRPTMPNGEENYTDNTNITEREFETEVSQNSGELNVPAQSQFTGVQYNGSMQQILAYNIGQFVVIEFLIGTDRLEERMGILFSVGSQVVILYEEIENRYIVCDIFSVKFVTFYEPNQRPGGYYRTANRTNSSVNGGMRAVGRM